MIWRVAYSLLYCEYKLAKLQDISLRHTFQGLVGLVPNCYTLIVAIFRTIEHKMVVSQRLFENPCMLFAYVLFIIMLSLNLV